MRSQVTHHAVVRLISVSRLVTRCHVVLLWVTAALVAAGTALAAPGISFSAGQTDFQHQLVGQPSGARTVLVTNSGDSPMVISNVNMQGPNAADFVIVSDSGEGTLAAGASRSVGIGFRPLSTGPRTGYLTVSSNVFGSPHVASLLGEGVSTYVNRSPASLDFGVQRVGTSSTQTVTIRNDGNTDLHMSGMSLGGTGVAAYSLAPGPCQGNAIAPGATCTFSVTFRPGAVQTYTATVSITDDAPYSPHRVSLTGDGSSPSVQPPRAPSGLSIRKVSLSQLDLSWTDNSSDETGFELQRRTPNSAYATVARLAANTTRYSDTGLTPLTTYIYRVRSYNDGGPSAYWSNEAWADTTDPPAAPSGLTGTVVSRTQIDLRWTDNSSNERAFAVYRWHPGTPETPTKIATLAPNSTAYSDRGVEADEQYAYQVRANGDGGISAPSNQFTVITPPPLAPSNLRVTVVSSTQLDLSWTNNHTHGVRIEVQRRTAQTEWASAGSVPIGSTSFSDTGRVSGVTYFYRVRVNGKTADSPWSNEASGTTP
jgi:hypothetical protein